MKKIFFMIILGVLMTGCGKEETCVTTENKVNYYDIFEEQYYSNNMDDITEEVISENTFNIEILLDHELPTGEFDEVEFFERENQKVGEELEIGYFSVIPGEPMIIIASYHVTMDVIDSINNVLCEDIVETVEIKLLRDTID